MKKNVVISMLVIALAAALLGGATYAWFTDKQSAEAKFTAGTLVLGEIEDFDGELDIEAPGDTDDWEITIVNEGSLDMYYRLYFTSDISVGLPEVVNVSLYAGDTLLFGPTCIGDFTDSENYWFNSELTLDADDDVTYKVHFELPTDTDDDYQGAEWVITLHVEATQVKNQDEESIKWGNTTP